MKNIRYWWSEYPKTISCNLPDLEKAVTYLKKMIARASEYYEIDDNTRPILVYGSKVCYEQLVLFASELASADSFIR